jgi:kynurenine formamidase
MSRLIDLSVAVNSNTMSPPSTNIRVEITPHRRGPGFWQVSSVNQGLHTGAHIDSPLHVFKDGITTAEIRLDQVIGEAVTIDLSFVNANHKITIDDLRRGGADNVRKGDIVLLRTNWTDKMYGRWPDYFVQSPFFPPESAEWLVAKDPSRSASISSRNTAPGSPTSPRRFPDAPGDSRRWNCDHGRNYELGSAASPTGTILRSVLQNRGNRRRAGSLLR